jgi:hypothetical protein
LAHLGLRGKTIFLRSVSLITVLALTQIADSAFHTLRRPRRNKSEEADTMEKREVFAGDP